MRAKEWEKNQQNTIQSGRLIKNGRYMCMLRAYCTSCHLFSFMQMLYSERKEIERFEIEQIKWLVLK